MLKSNDKHSTTGLFSRSVANELDESDASVYCQKVE